MSTSILSRCLLTAALSFGLLCGVGLAPSVVGAASAAPNADDLRTLVVRDGWLLVRVELSSTPISADARLLNAEAGAQDVAVEDLLFGLPEGSYADFERGRENSTLMMRVDPAGLDGLLAFSEVVGVIPAGTAEPLCPLCSLCARQNSC